MASAHRVGGGCGVRLFGAARSIYGLAEASQRSDSAGWDNLSRAVGVESLINWRQVNLIARCQSLKRALLWLAVQSLGLSACGGKADVVRSPAPAKIAWGQAEAASKPDESAVARGSTEAEPTPAKPSAVEPKAVEPSPVEPSPAKPGEIDLDATTSSAEPEDDAAEPAGVGPASNPLARELQKRRTSANAQTVKAKGKSKAKTPSAKKSVSAAPAASTYTGSDPCKAASFSVSRVREACASGGRPAAKRVMKDAIGKATATGQSLKCSDCHANQRDYALKPAAVAELSRWLASSGS